MMIKGTVHRVSPTDYFQRCKSCRRMFYFSRDCHGKSVICPHCGTVH